MVEIPYEIKFEIAYPESMSNIPYLKHKIIDTVIRIFLRNSNLNVNLESPQAFKMLIFRE